MNPEYLLTILNNRLVTLRNGKIAAEQAGELERVLQIEQEIEATELSISKLQQ